MLVIASDIHLTDGSSGTTIDPRAFDKFSRAIEDIISNPKESKIEDVEIVLLGDIFDVIRSDIWLKPENNQGEHPIRPWSDSAETDGGGWNLEAYTKAIVDKIVNNEKNIRARDSLSEFRSRMKDKGVNVELSYMIGNHDWLINRYPSTRQVIADFLGLKDAASVAATPFPYSRVFNDYKVFARHGDFYDKFNFEGNRDESSLGDAIVIDLLNRFPQAVEQDDMLGAMKDVKEKVREIDNVRPLVEVTGWLQGICNECDEAEERIHQIWNNMVDEFFDIRFVKKHDRFGPSFIDLLQGALRISSSFSLKNLRSITSSFVVKKFFSGSGSYRGHAYKEDALRSNNAKYAVFGHTHRAEQVPLDAVLGIGRSAMEKVYFNTGTWRKVFEATAFDKDECKFIGWHVMSFVVFYNNIEKGDRNYEVWSGSLGYGSE